MHDDPGPAAPAPADMTAVPAPPPPAPSQLSDTVVGAPRVDADALASAAPSAVPSFLQPVTMGNPEGVPQTPPAQPTAAGAQPLPERASTTFLVVVTVISLAADLVTKGWAKGRLSSLDGKGHALRRMPVWKDHLEFVFAQNPGGAWSFLRGLPDTLRRPFFLVVSAAAIVFIITIYRRVHKDQTAMRWGLPLALGGAMGNLVDRIRYGWVVDFIDFSMKWGGKDHHWPTFNVADIAIVAGVALMGMDMFRSRRHHASDQVAHAPAA